MRKNIYLERYAWPQSEIHLPDDSLPDIIIVIPAHNEPGLVKAIQSLQNCTPPIGEVLIIVVFNESEDAPESIVDTNKASLLEVKTLNGPFRIETMHLQLPGKKAGVGLARKIGMDEAVRIFERQEKDGIIVCYDADCTCDENYLQAIEGYYKAPENNLGLVHYEHDLTGDHQEAIINYELYLRYYNNGLRVSGYPFAVQTLGSCITVKSSAYQKQGGMNTRKAGEDFYFIHKVTPIGGIGEINDTCIAPSDRVSDRVPFGTGHAIHKYLDEPDPSYPVYHYRTFEDLKWINRDLKTMYKAAKLPEGLPESLITFYSSNGFDLKSLIKQSGNAHNFTQRYYRWWDGFRVLKYIHYCRDHYHPKIPLAEALLWLSGQIEGLKISGTNKHEQLLRLRAFDKQQYFYIKRSL